MAEKSSNEKKSGSPALPKAEKKSAGSAPAIAAKKPKSFEEYPRWQKRGIRIDGGTYELIESGILGVDEGSIVFTADRGSFNIPVYGTHNINIYSDVTIDSGLLALLRKNNITLTVFDKKGECLGRFTSGHTVQKAEVFLKQCSIYQDPQLRLYLAKKFVNGEIFNMNSNLLYYRNKRETGRLAQTAEQLKLLLSEAGSCNAYSDLLLTEARAKMCYFSCFNEITGGGLFEFTGRTRRPPKDPINALISFGNAVLYNFIANDIQKTSLDVKIGYLHATGKRSESLNLDVAELFKPLVVDRAVFSAINRQSLNKSCFESKNGGVYLSPEGKRVFLSCLYEKLAMVQKTGGTSVSYEGLIWRELQKIRHYVENPAGGYKPYHYGE